MSHTPWMEGYRLSTGFLSFRTCKRKGFETAVVGIGLRESGLANKSSTRFGSKRQRNKRSPPLASFCRGIFQSLETDTGHPMARGSSCARLPPGTAQLVRRVPKTFS